MPPEFALMLFSYVVLLANASYAPLVTLNSSSQPAADNVISRQQMMPVEEAVCDVLQTKQQRHLCHKRSAAKLLVSASYIARQQCQQQFKANRWNCSLEGPHIHNIMAAGLRESGFVSAISSASLVYRFARACSEHEAGEWCTCDASLPLAENKQAWMWGGCGDNIKYGLKFAKKFLGTDSWEKRLDLRDRVDQHNTLVGIKVVQKSVGLTCKCHGVSGSCTVKTCWKQLAPLHKISSTLKNKYERAKPVTDNRVTAGGGLSLKRRKKTKHRRKKTPKYKVLVYMIKSPNFCEASPFSVGTKGRSCDIKGRNCEEMCCGRGHNVRREVVNKACRCRVLWCCKVVCDTCPELVDFYTCK